LQLTDKIARHRLHQGPRVCHGRALLDEGCKVTFVRGGEEDWSTRPLSSGACRAPRRACWPPGHLRPRRAWPMSCSARSKPSAASISSSTTSGSGKARHRPYHGRRVARGVRPDAVPPCAPRAGCAADAEAWRRRDRHDRVHLGRESAPHDLQTRSKRRDSLAKAMAQQLGRQHPRHSVARGRFACGRVVGPPCSGRSEGC